jgi:hypothetical protein
VTSYVLVTIAAVPPAAGENPGSAGLSREADVDVATLFAQLKEEVRRVGPRPAAGAGPSSDRVNARSAAERLWPVTADRPPAGRAGAAGAALKPVKLVLRRLMRWYVEPVFADQRAFNDAVLRLIDDIYEQLDRERPDRAADRASGTEPQAP